MDPRFCLISALIFLPLLSNSPILILAQINTPCSPTMLSSVTGCMNFLTGGGSSPTTDCCEALKSLTGTGLDCLCLIVTASVPINLPINRTLAISLPRACGMPGVPVKCKGYLISFFSIINTLSRIIICLLMFYIYISTSIYIFQFLIFYRKFCEILQLLQHLFLLQVNWFI